jgi:hypothetical protein
VRYLSGLTRILIELPPPMRHVSTHLDTQVHTSARTCRRVDVAPPTAGEQAHTVQCTQHSFAMHLTCTRRHCCSNYPECNFLRHAIACVERPCSSPRLLAHSVSLSLTQACSDSHAAHASLTQSRTNLLDSLRSLTSLTALHTLVTSHFLGRRD